MNQEKDVFAVPPPVASIAQAIDEAEEVDLKPKYIGPKTETPPDIVPLGHVGVRYYFISSAGEKLDFNARDLIRLNISSLFGGDTQWLSDNFPIYNKKDEKILNAFNANNAAEWLMRQCRAAGLFNPETPLRRLGVWRAGDEVVAHLGGDVWYKKIKQKAGCVINHAIYTACNTMQLPDFDNPADRFDALRLRQNMNVWAFGQKNDADLLFGFMGAALLGGFPKWRVHALVTGEGGSGKSTLGRYLTAVIGAQSTTMNDYSEAGVRQSLTNEARMVWLDEGESSGEEQAHRMAKVVSLLRKMSDGDGARIARGTSGGVALSATVTGCVLLTAINPPPLQPQDRSRILTVPIHKPASGCSSEDIRAFLKEATDLSPRIRARALIGSKRFVATFDLYRTVLRNHACDDRRADFFATMLAGRSLLLDDEVPNVAQADAYVTLLRDRLQLIMLDDSDVSDGQLCLNRMLDAECPSIRDGIRRSIGQMVGDGLNPPGNPENEKLVPIGIKIVDNKGDINDRLMFVANDHLGLKKIFHNTPWADGNWRASLLRLPGVRPSPVPISIGRKARGLLIPKSLLPVYDQGEAVDYDPPPDPVPQRGLK